MLLPVFFSFLQICFIPGFIAYLLIVGKSNNPKPLLIPVFSFGLSLIINYIIVTSLAYFHIYTRFALTIFITIEVIMLGIIVLHIKNLEAYNVRVIWTELLNEIRFLTDKLKSPYLFSFILFFSSLLLLLFLLRILFLDAGKIFEESDAIFSWNKWALDFYNNKLPINTYHYPQLIPANWSIAYVLCKYPLQFVPRVIMHLFLIFQVYSFIVLGVSQRSTFYFIAAFIIYVLFSSRGFFWTDGFVDVSVSFFAIMAYISLVSIKIDETTGDKMKIIFVSFIFVCGAAVTKQAGLFILISYPILLYVLLKDKFIWTHRRLLMFFLFCLIVSCLIVLPYYVLAEIAIKNGNAASEILYVTHDIYKGATFSERFSHALTIFETIFGGKLILICFIISFLLSFSNKTLAYINLFIVVPYFIIWALFFSYDIRNVSLIIPFFSLGTAYGLNFLSDLLPKIYEFLRSIKIKSGIIPFTYKALIIISVPIVLWVLNSTLEIERLRNSQDFRLKKLGDEEVNEKLYLYKSRESINRKILTDYHYLGLLPEIKQYFQYCQIQDLNPTSAEIQDESIGFLLWNPWYTDSTKFPSFIDSNIKSGVYKEIFDHNGFRFIKIR